MHNFPLSKQRCAETEMFLSYSSTAPGGGMEEMVIKLKITH